MEGLVSLTRTYSCEPVASAKQPPPPALAETRRFTFFWSHMWPRSGSKQHTKQYNRSHLYRSHFGSRSACLQLPCVHVGFFRQRSIWLVKRDILGPPLSRLLRLNPNTCRRRRRPNCFRRIRNTRRTKLRTAANQPHRRRALRMLSPKVRMRSTARPSDR